MKIGSDILWLSEADVASLLTMEEALAAVEEGFRLHGEGQVQLPAKIYLTFDPYDGDLRAMPTYVKGSMLAAGVKIVNSTPSNPARGLPAVAGIMVYVDPQTGLPLGVFGAGHLTSVRTGAAGGIAAKFLARKNSSSVGLIGCGRQAATQLEALQPFFRIENVKVWGQTPEESQAFINANAKRFKARFELCPSVEETCAVDILVTTTPVRTPVVASKWVRAGTHVNAIGADAPGKQELETDLIKRSRVVVDDWAQASHAGEINVPVSQKAFSKDQLAGQLGEIITGRKKGRLSDADITVFDSTGLALQDVVVSKIIYEKAVKTKKGQILPLYG